MTSTSLLITGIYFLLGLAILYKRQFPLRGTHVIVGRDAFILGCAYLVPGFISLVCYLLVQSFVPGQANYLSDVGHISIIADTAMLIGLVIALIIIITARRIEVEKPKRSPLPDVLTVSEAARYLKVEEVYVLHLIEDGELKAKSIGGEYRISREALKDYFRS